MAEVEPVSLVFRKVINPPGLEEGDYQSLFPHYINAIKYDIESVWSENTRRNSSAKMTGKIKANKYKLEVSYKADLPQNKLAILRSIVRSTTEWHDIMFTDETGTNVTKTFYFGTYNVEPYCFWNGTMYYQSINITLIER